MRLRLIVLAALVLFATRTSADPPSRNAELRIDAPVSLPLGPGRIPVILRPPVGPVMPLLLTITVEGDALQAVRARFLRADARLEKTGELRFEVPVLARAAGIAMMRAEVSAYRCFRQSDQCEQLRAQAAVQLQVAAVTR